MINCDIKLAQKHIDKATFTTAANKVAEAVKTVENKSGKGAEWLGWQDLMSHPNDALLQDIGLLAEQIRKDADVFIVCGIGGSYLGAKAVIEALKSPFPGTDEVEILYAGHHMSGAYLEELIKYLKTPKADGTPKSIYLNVISKSGTTLETALSFRLLRELMDQMYDDSNKRIICTTSKEGGVLNKLIQQNGYKKYIIPDDVGGRFSVLTPVGLLPIAVAGIDIRTLYYGAVSQYKNIKEDNTSVVEYATVRHALLKQGITIDVFSCFEPQLNAFGGWIQQLLGESEGKQGKGLFPSVAAFSTDLHSLGQFIQQGTRSLMETFIVVEEANSKLAVNNLEDNDDGLNYLSGKTFHEINTKARLGTTQAHSSGDVPIVNISMQKLNEQYIGELIYFFEYFTAIYVYSLGVNPFDQPGVEDYKKAMYQLLGK